MIAILALVAVSLAGGASRATPVVLNELHVNAEPVVLTGFLTYPDSSRFSVILARTGASGVEITFVDFAGAAPSSPTVERTVDPEGLLKLVPVPGDPRPGVHLDVTLRAAGRITLESTTDHWSDGFILPFLLGTTNGIILINDHIEPETIPDLLPSPPDTIGRGVPVGSVDGEPINSIEESIHWSTTPVDVLLTLIAV